MITRSRRRSRRSKENKLKY